MYKIKQSADCFILCHIRTAFEEDKKKQMTPFEREFALLRLICMYLSAFFTLTKLEGSTVIEL